MAKTFLKYGLNWPQGSSPLLIEFYMIRKLYDSKSDHLVQHYLSVHKLLWPEDEQHRWFVLGIKSIVKNQVSMFLGCASSGKTYTMACHALMDFFIFPRTSLALVSSTERRSLELKVFGRIKELFNRARKKYPELEGYILDSAMVITPDEVDDDNEVARTMDRGIVCVPCVSGGRFIGMSKFQGAKAPNTPGKFDGILKHYGDEFAVMQNSILDAYTNWTVNPRFKGVGSGNPTDISDPLCIASEPTCGWEAFIDTGKTQEWTSKWYSAHVVAFDGRDSPSNDDPKKKYQFLVSNEWIESLKKTHGEDSWQLYQQGIGKPSRGMVSNRVLTIGFCEQHKAFETPVWITSPTIKLAACDPAFGGGDRCVWITGRIGTGADGRQILEIDEPEIITIRLGYKLEPEEQIAAFIKERCDRQSIPPENVSYDSFGRAGVLGFFFNQLFGANTPVPVDSGGKPTARPVRSDLYVTENGKPRLKRCDEAYSKRVTEFWFSVREAVHSEQIRGLPRSVAQEFQMRIFSVVTGNRVEIEPKDEMKERIKKSPDLADATSFLVEGARRLGFEIERLGKDIKPKPDDENYFASEAKAWNDAVKSGLLKH